jgi:phosphopantetheinyl transferase
MQLSILLSAEASELRFRLGPQGKPSVADREDLHFNLSHAGDFAAIATGPQPLGVDIEVIRPEVDARSLAQHYFRTEEAAALRATRTPLQDFFLLWTAKEAVMKCTGLGLSLPPDAVAVSGAAARRTDTGARFALFTHADGDAAFVLTAAVEV